MAVTVSGNNLTKTGADGWSSGASSTQSIASGDGYVEFTAGETSTYRMIGLSHGDTDQGYGDIDFAIYPIVGGGIQVYEGGYYRGGFGTFATGDILRVAVEGGVVKYKKNGTVLYTSTVAPAYPLLVDTSLYSNGATINNVVLSGAGSGGSSSAQIHWLVTDQLGTPRMIFDQTGSLANVSRHDYLPFGEELFAGTGGRTAAQGYTNSDGTRQKFTRKERDIETGLDFFEARYYASTQGRFTGVDPFNIALDVQEEAKANPKKAAAKLQVYLSMPQQWNRYSYAMNNPLLYIDPEGEAIQLSNDKDERERQLQALRDAVGSNAAGYLYANQGSDGNWYVGIYGQNPTNGDTRGFSNANEVAAGFDAIIRDPQVAKVEMVRPGTVTEDGGASADIGAAGRSLLYPGGTNGNSPAATGIFKGQLTIKLLDWGKSGLWGKFNLGYLPGALMSDGKNNMVTPSMMVAHELAHAWYQMCGLGRDREGSNEYAVDFENKVRKLQNPNGPTRKLHSMPIN